jgi:hypothetical protein
VSIKQRSANIPTNVGARNMYLNLIYAAIYRRIQQLSDQHMFMQCVHDQSLLNEY